MSTEVDLSVLIAEAMGHNRKVHKDIDKLYAVNQHEFYKMASKSDNYNHMIIKEGDIYREEYAKKALGIINYLIENSGIIENEEDEFVLSIHDKFLKIIKKGWKRPYAFVKNNEEISLENYLWYIKSANHKNDDDFNTELTMVMWIAQCDGKKIIRDEVLTKQEEFILTRLDHTSKNSKLRYSHKFMDEKMLKNVITLKQRVYREYGELNSYDNIFMHNYFNPAEGVDPFPASFKSNGVDDTDEVNVVAQTGNMFSFIVDSEKLSLSSIFNNVKMQEKDIEEVLGVYYMIIRNKNTKNAAKFLVWGLLVKGICKAFKDVKEQYFKNNNELISIEAENQQAENEQLREENNKLKEKVARLESSIDKIRVEEEQKHYDRIKNLENEVSRLKGELVEEKRKERELIALREFLFSLDQEKIPDEKISEFDPAEFKGVIVGGHSKWQNRMQELLPGWKFIASEGFDERLLSGVDIIFFNTQFLNHGVYYKTVNAARRYDVPIGYINSINEKRAMSEMKHRLSNVFSGNVNKKARTS